MASPRVTGNQTLLGLRDRENGSAAVIARVLPEAIRRVIFDAGLLHFVTNDAVAYFIPHPSYLIVHRLFSVIFPAYRKKHYFCGRKL
jgi:hypothetical protein